ncbi:MAG: 30S ribosomal protein S21 [Rickettsiales bacterium]|nr:30S ribosomal protein S21 [Rickettsiales bacterium]
MVQVNVRDNNVEAALRTLKKKLQKEGLFKEVKQRRYYEKPSEKKLRKSEEALKKNRKSNRYFD